MQSVIAFLTPGWRSLRELALGCPAARFQRAFRHRILNPRVALAARACPVEHLQAEEAALWKWFASERKRGEEAEAVRLELLKSTYRLEQQSQPKLYELANNVRERLQLTCSLTLYQAQTGNTLNAGLAYLPGEAHIILAGPLASVLADAEVRAVLAHEMSHFLLLRSSSK